LAPLASPHQRDLLILGHRLLEQQRALIWRQRPVTPRMSGFGGARRRYGVGGGHPSVEQHGGRDHCRGADNRDREAKQL